MKRIHASAGIALAATSSLILLDVTTSSASTSLAGSRGVAPAYAMVDVGTFGGPHAEVDGPAIQITRDGGVLGAADTTTPDLDYPNDGPAGGDPLIEHAFEWRGGHLDDLGALPGNNSSFAFEMNRFGLGTGASETGGIDPLTDTPAQHAVLFRHGHVADLGTLPGGTESFAIAVNDRGQVAGLSNNSVPDPTGFPNFFDWRTEVRTFVWQNGVMRDIGTLGGDDTGGGLLNGRGQVAGDSFVDTTPNAITGFPTSHPFLWTRGRMRDLGTLGGAQSYTNWVNDRGQVVGMASLPGEQTLDPFLWDGHRLRDLGTLGGDFGNAWMVNDHGTVTGVASTAGDEDFHTFLWRHGIMTDLSRSADNDCTFPEGINNHDQVVGGTCDGAALLWRNGRQYDLNALVEPSDVQLTDATWIDDHGRIVSLGVLPDGNQHVFLLTPTGHPMVARPLSTRRSTYDAPGCRVPVHGLVPETRSPRGC